MEFEITCQDVLVVKTLSNSTPQIGIMNHIHKINTALDSTGGMISGLELSSSDNATSCGDLGDSHLHIGEIAVISHNRHKSQRILAKFFRKSDYGRVPPDEIWSNGKLGVSDEVTDTVSFEGDLIITEPLAIVSRVKSRITQEMVSEIAYWTREVQSASMSAELAARSVFYRSALDAFSLHRRRVMELVGSDTARRVGIVANWIDVYGVYPESSPNTNIYLYHGFEPYSLVCFPPTCIELLGVKSANSYPFIIHFEDEFSN